MNTTKSAGIDNANGDNVVHSFTIASYKEVLDVLQGFALISNAECRDAAHPLFLFRGQKIGYQLKSSIERFRTPSDSIHLGRMMFQEFKSRCRFAAAYSDWDVLSFSRHYELPSRYLDWSSNPLVSLWFACRDTPSTATTNAKKDSVLWVLRTEMSDYVEVNLGDDPFPMAQGKTCIFKPTEMEYRIKNQNSFMMRQVYEYKNPLCRTRKPEDMEIKAVENNPIYKGRLWRIVIPHSLFGEIKEYLSHYGITKEFLFPKTFFVDEDRVGRVVEEIKQDAISKQNSSRNEKEAK